jgi:hypothetical protein
VATGEAASRADQIEEAGGWVSEEVEAGFLSELKVAISLLPLLAKCRRLPAKTKKAIKAAVTKWASLAFRVDRKPSKVRPKDLPPPEYWQGLSRSKNVKPANDDLPRPRILLRRGINRIQVNHAAGGQDGALAAGIFLGQLVN